MKFYDREKELEMLSRCSKTSGFEFIVVSGMRRIGKTRLLLEFLSKRDYAYVFVAKDKTTTAFLKDISVDLGIPEFHRITDLLKYLFETKKYVFFDEFQNFYYMDKSIYSDFQKVIDEYKQKGKQTCLFVSGSSFSLMRKIFADYSHPLYGRKDVQIDLAEFEFPVVCDILQDMGITDVEEKIKYFSVFGGVPKYYEIIEKQEDKNFERCIVDLFFGGKTSFLADEGKSVLVTEFGGEYKTYFSVLEAIAQGRTRLNEIAGMFENKTNVTTKYVDMLRKEYNLVMRQTPILDDPRKSRAGIYRLRSHFLDFWFSFVKRYEGFYEQGRMDEIKSVFIENYNSYVSYVFEDIARMMLVKKKPFDFDKAGRQWGVFKGVKGQNSYEIDIVAVNEKTREIGFFECKWKDLNRKQAASVLAELEQKSAYVEWHKGDNRTEYFGLIAKKIEGKDNLRKKGFFAFDLEDVMCHEN